MSNFEIVAREDFSPVTYLLEVRHPLLAKAAKPGQFVIVMSHAEGERIPLTIADFDREAGTITLVIQAVGKTTKEMQENCRAGTSLYAVVGPMGIPSALAHVKKALCVGGGLGVAYVGAESAPTITEWAEAVHLACKEAGIPEHVRVTAEPGRAIAATAGITVYRVGTIKELHGVRTYVAVDGGMSDNPRPVLYGSGYEVMLPRSPDAPRPRAVTVVGKHCESGDVVVADGRVPEDLAVGDLLATPVTGAYGYSMASNYNKVPRPAVVFVADGRARLVVRRESDDDLVRLDA